MELNDVYDEKRNLTGKLHRRGRPWKKGEYGLVVCAWVYDGHGNVLLTRRAPEKSFPGTWENSGGAALAGETSRQAMARELFEETGIRAEASEFEFLESGTDHSFHYDYYCLKRNTPVEKVVLLPGETDGVKWVSYEQVHEMIRRRQICKIIAEQFKRQEKYLRERDAVK